MHHLADIRVQNFRSCQDVELALGHCTPIGGYNNAGKSNLLAALEWLVTGRVLSVTDFRDSQRPIRVEGTLGGLGKALLDELSEGHRSKIEPYINGGQLRLRRTQPAPDVKKNDIRFEVRDPNAGSGDHAWGPNPGGIDNALKALFPEPIWVGAMQDAAEDATKAKATSTIGKLLAQFTGPAEARHGAELERALAPLHDKLTASGSSRAAELNRFDDEATDALQPFFPGIQLHLDVPVPSVEALFGKGTIKVREQGRDGSLRDFTALGHGAQRSIQMALIRYLADVRADEQATAQRRLLLIEEPELFLHPQAVEQVRRALVSLSHHGYQVVFATHSPIMVAREAAASARIVRKDRQTGETRVMATAHEALEQRVADDNKRLHALFCLENTNDWLFSDRVLVAEGPTERYLLPFIYEAVTGRKPADDGLAILGLGGAGSLPESLNVFRELGIEVRALADLDFAANQAVQHGLMARDDEDLLKCLSQIRGMADKDASISLDGKGRPQSDKNNPAGNKKPAVVFREWAAMPNALPVVENLHRKLRDQKIWLWRGGDIEHHLGLTGAKKDMTTWAPFRRRLQQEPYRDVIPDTATIDALVLWMGRSTPQ